jgi:hypothetical protein
MVTTSTDLIDWHRSCSPNGECVRDLGTFPTMAGAKAQQRNVTAGDGDDGHGRRTGYGKNRPRTKAAREKNRRARIMQASSKNNQKGVQIE